MVQQAFRVDNLSTSNIEFKANSFVSSLVANTALASNVHLVLPGSVGTSGQILATDGSGNLSFINQSAGGSIDTLQDNVNATNANVNLVQNNVTSLTSTVDSFGVYANNTFGFGGSNVSVANVTSQEFSLDGSTNTFTLVNSTDNVNKLLVSYGGIAQKPSEYQVSNTTLTLSNTRPLVSGTTLEVRFLDFEFAGSVTNTGNAGIVAGGATTVIAPIAFGSVADVTNGSGTNLNWSNWNSSNSTLDFTFDTPQPDTNYTVVTDCEVFDDAFVQITNKTTTGFRASFYDNSQSLQPSSFREFTFIVYGSTPTVDVNSLSGTSYSTTLYSNLAAGTTTFNANSTPALATYTSGKIGVYRNGVKLPSTDYTASDGTSLTLNNATLLGDSIEVVNFGTLSLALDDITDVDLTTNSPANGQALVYVSASSKWVPGTVAGSYGNSDVDAHLNQSTATTNQVLSWDGSDYAWVDQSAGGSSSGAALTEYEFTATANQTSFAATYIPNSIQVFLNGVKLANTDFTATNGTSVVLGANTASGDIVAISKIGGSSNLTVANASASGAGTISYDSGSEILTYTPPDLSGYQSTLVSNTNIKTINGTSLLGSGDISTGGGVAGTLGSLTKTFSNNETATITLSSNVSPVPNVSVFKEVPQPGVSSKGNWDVNANATNYEFFDEKPISYSNITLTPSATGDGTFTASPLSGYSLSGPSFGSSFNVGSQASNPQEVVMKTDGTKMYVLDVTSKTIFEYDLSTNFDSSTATYNSVNSGSLGTTISGDPYGLRFKPDGTKLYICEYGGILYQFSLGTAWDLSTISYDNTSITNFAGSGNIPYCLAFKSDGTKVYTVGYARLYEWVLPTAWSLSGATPTNIANGASADYLNISSYINSNSVYALDFSADGTKFFVRAVGSGSVGNGLFEVPIDSAWDPVNSTQQPISTDGSLAAGIIRYDALNTAHGNTNITGFAFVNNGQQAVVCYSGAQDYVYTLNTFEAFNFSSTDVGKKVVGNSGTAIINSTAGAYTSVTPFADTSAISSWQLFGAEGKADGSGIELSGYSTSTPVIFPTSGNGVGATMNYNNNVSSAITNIVHVGFNSEGTIAIVMVAGLSTGYKFTRYDLSIPFDLSTLTEDATKVNTNEMTSGVKWLWVHPDGTKIWISDTGANRIKYFTMSTAWDPSTASYVGYYYFNSGGSWNSTSGGGGAPSSTTLQPYAFEFNSDGTKLLVGYFDNSAYNGLAEYTLSTAYDMSTMTYVSYVDVTTGTTPYSFVVSEDGLSVLRGYSGGTAGLGYSLTLPSYFSVGSTSLSNIGNINFRTLTGDAGVSAYAARTLMSYDKKRLWLCDMSTKKIFEITGGTSSVHPYSQYFPTLTNSTGQINSSAWQDINSMTADETKNDGDVFYAVSTDNRTSWGVIKDGDGVRKIARNNSGTWQYNNDGGSATYYDFSNPTAGAVATSFTTPGWTSLAFNTSGDRVLLTDASYLYSYSLSTSWDISTITSTPIGTSPIALGYSAGNNAFVSYLISDDGTKAIGRYNANGITYEYSMSTPFDVTTLSLVGSANLGLGGQFYIKPGTYDTFYVTSGRSLHKYTFTGGSITTGTLTQDGTVNLDPTNTKSFGYGQILFKPDGTEFYITQTTDSIIEKWTLGTAWDITTATKSSETAAFSGIGAVWLKPDGTKIYYIDTNNSNQLSEINIGGFGYGTSETWVNGTNNNEHATLQQALTSQSFNRMDKAQLQAVTDPNHYVLGNTLDLMIAPYATSGASPISDGVTINYDAEVFVEQAINGTDYKARFSAANSVSIISLADQNLKVRVI